MIDRIICPHCGNHFDITKACKDSDGKFCCPACGYQLDGLDIPKDMVIKPTLNCNFNLVVDDTTVTIMFVDKNEGRTVFSGTLDVDAAQILATGLVDACTTLRRIQRRDR